MISDFIDLSYKIDKLGVIMVLVIT